MKKLFFIIAAGCIYLASCDNPREEADQTNRDSVESRSTDTAGNMGTDTSATQHNPAAPGATNAEF
jgi:hypothetical protein